MISRAAASIDQFLLRNFIGNFELIYYYHLWRSRPRDHRDASYDPARALQRSLNRDLSCVVNTEFCEGLIAYYDTL